MRYKFSFLVLLFSMQLGLMAQTVDVTKVVADTKTFIFSDGKNTVKSYIYEMLETQTTCCGAGRMYLEVKIDPSGYVINVKPLTGVSKECYAKSVQDIIKNIKWDASGLKGPKNVYFEIKPEVECADGKDNVYAQVKIFNNEKVDVNGVPMNYAAANNESASAANGTSSTPPGMPSQPTASTEDPQDPPAQTDPEQAEPEAQDPPVAETETKESGVKETRMTGQAPKEKTTSGREFEKAGSMAEKTAQEQSVEITRLKEELAILNAEKKDKEEQRLRDQRVEEEAAEKDAEADRRRRDKEEREAVAQRQKEREDRDREREDERRNRERDNNRGNSGDFKTVNYGDDKQYDNNGGNYGDNNDQDPPPQSAAEIAADERQRLQQEKDRTQQALRDLDNQVIRQTRDRERLREDLRKAEGKILDQELRAKQDSDRQELENLENARREIEEKKRLMERQLQERMDELNRMKIEIDRALADLERAEQEAAQKGTEIANRQQATTMEQAQMSAEHEVKKEQMRLTSQSQSGGNGHVQTGGGIPANIFAGIDDGDSTGKKQMIYMLLNLNEQLKEVQAQLNRMQGGGGSYAQNPSYSINPGQGRPSPSVRKSSTKQAKGQPRVASLKELRGMDSNAIFDSSKKEQYKTGTFEKIENGLTNVSSGSGGATNSFNSTHDNLPGPQFSLPSYRGGEQAMKKFISDELRKSNMCGLAHAVYEVTVNGEGIVISYRIISRNTGDIDLYLPGVLRRLVFEATGSGMPSNLIYEFKGELLCEDAERINIDGIESKIKN